MKKSITIFFVCCVTIQAMAAYQMRNWTLLPNKVFMSYGSAPVVTTIPGASTAQYKVANGAYDENNNLLFYVQDENIYNATSGYVGYLPIGGGTLKEIVIVPVPGQCKKYYVIMAAAWPLTGIELWQTTVDCSGATVVKGANVKFANLNGNYCGLAASKIVSGSGSTAIRYLYATTYNNVSRFTISNTGFSTATTLASPPTIAQATTEADLNLDGTKFAWGEYNTSSGGGRVFEMLTSSPYTLTTYTLPPQSPCTVSNQAISGVEYDGFGNLWVSATSSCPSNKGIYKITTTATPSYNYIAGTSNYDNTQLERSVYGNILSVSNSGTFGYIDISNNSFSTNALNIPVTLVSNKNAVLIQGVYSLPDQIDGEDYTYFNGVPQGVANYQISGVAPTTNCASFQQVYNCSAITLTNLSTGATSYTLEVNSLDASCNIISGAGLLTYTSGTVTMLPTDLRAMPGTNGTWLATHTGKFVVKLTASNGCTTTSKLAYIQVNTAPTAVSTCFTFANNNTCARAGVAGGTSCATAVSTCMNNPKIKADCSGGQFINGTFDIKIDEYSSACAFLGTVGNSVNWPLNSTADLVCLSLNDYTTVGGFFYGNVAGRKYAITLTIRNLCSSSSVTKWFADNVTTCKTDGDETATGINEAENNGLINLHPNPSNGNSTLTFTLATDSRVNLVVVDMQGKLVSTVVKNEQLSSGEHNLPIALSAYAAGVYFYHLTIDDKIYQGKLIKTN